MDTTKLILGTVVGAVVFFLAGWLIYGILLTKTMEAGMTPEGLAMQLESPNLAGLLLSNALWAFLYAYIFERWAGIRTWQTGAIAGGVIGGLFAASVDISFLSMTKMFTGIGAIIPDILASTAMSVLAGAAIGFTLGYNRKS